MSVNESLLDAIELLTNSTISKAGYDKTIEAQIISCEDSFTGKYKCKYQDSIFYAYSNNTNNRYKKDDYVYILVPCGDMGKDKTIISSSDRVVDIFKINDNNEQEDLYETIGNNCIISTNNIYLNSLYNYNYELYNCQSQSNKINFNLISLEKYLKQADAFRFSAFVTTNLSPERQMKGTYGLKFVLLFKDEFAKSSDEYIQKEYIFSEERMLGESPYNLKNKKETISFKINGKNFIKIKSISLFCSNFPNAENSFPENDAEEGDIKFSALSFIGLSSFEKEELEGIKIFFDTPKGTIFTSAVENEILPITAIVKVNGRTISKEQKLNFYWGIEDTKINKESYYYNKYLGCGWRCLNNNSKITDYSAQWVPNDGTFYYSKEYDQTLYPLKNKLRVALASDEGYYYNDIIITNMTKSSEKDVLLISKGNQTHFYNDSGIIELSCENNLPFSLDYYWGQENPDGNFLTILPYEATSKEISAEVNSITDFSIFKCSLYNKDIFLGTASITIYNSLKKNQLNVISGWNGENVQINKKSIISPIIGTGMIGKDGQFTGVTMGTQKTFKTEDEIDEDEIDEDEINYNSGIFGYHNGTRTFFLNSQTGAAIFGSKDSGSLVIDPKNSKQLLMYGSSFWKEDKLTDDGIPKKYNYLIREEKPDKTVNFKLNEDLVDNTENGMLIDFANSCIAFGNGNFMVTPAGILKAKDAILSGRISSDDSGETQRVLINEGCFQIYDAEKDKDQQGNDRKNQKGQPIYKPIEQDNQHKGFFLGEVVSGINRHTVLYSGGSRTGIGIGEQLMGNSKNELYTYYQCYTNKTNEVHGYRHRFNGGLVFMETGLLVREGLYLDQGSSVLFKTNDSNDPYLIGFRYLDDGEIPNLEQGLHLGISTKKLCLWGSSISASSAITTTSDRRAKTQIKQLDNRYLQTIKNLNPILFKYKTNNEKTHSGFIAQDVLSIMQENGISENEWAVVECPKETDSQYALRYEEFIPALLLYIKSLQKDLNELKKEVEKLK